MITSLEKKILQELLVACSLSPNLFSFFFPLIQKFQNQQIDSENWSFFNPSFLYKLYQNSFFTFDQITKILPNNYLVSEVGLNKSKTNNYYYYKEEFNDFTGKLVTSIRNDQIELLSFLSTYNLFSFDQYLKLFDKIYNYSLIPLLHYSIQCHSKKCFKFLLLNGADPSLTSNGWNKWDAMAFAVASGDFVFIKILEDNGIYYNENSANAAAKFHQNSVLKWLIDHHIDTLTYTLLSAVETNNLEGIFYLLQHTMVNISTVKNYIVF